MRTWASFTRILSLPQRYKQGITMSDEKSITPPQYVIGQGNPFDAVVEFALTTIAPSSARVYGQTYDLWREWAKNNGINLLDLRPLNVRQFLTEQSVTKSTRQRQLSAMRKLARVMALDTNHPKYRSIYEALRMLRVPMDGIGGKERTRRALSAEQVWISLNVWYDKEKLQHIRNRALLAVLFYTGARRSEVATLRWDDMNFHEGTVIIRHGKGDKRREVAVVEGNNDVALHALLFWREQQSLHSEYERDYIFCAINKGDNMQSDQPITALAINQIIKKTIAETGIEFTPHDARRTLGTDLLTNGFSTSDVQAQLGHAHASTTIQGYSMPADARKRRGRFKTSY